MLSITINLVIMNEDDRSLKHLIGNASYHSATELKNVINIHIAPYKVLRAIPISSRTMRA